MPKCLNCGKEFPVCKYNSKKRCCCKKCGRAYHYKQNIEKERDNCKKWYSKNRESELEKNREYRKEKHELFVWYHNKDRFNGLRDSILKRDGEACKACGKTNKLAVHHIDGTNYIKGNANNDEKNLITLCSSCHSRLHHWQRKNQVLKTEDDIVRTIRGLIEANSKS